MDPNDYRSMNPEAVLEERMMNLVSLIAEQIRDKRDLFDREAVIMQALINEGYHVEEADAALTLVRTLVLDAAAGHAGRTNGVRVMSRMERSRFSPEAFGFVSRLTRFGIVSEDQREDILERAMSVYTGRIELNHMKSLVALILFAADQELWIDAHNAARRPKENIWN